MAEPERARPSEREGARRTGRGQAQAAPHNSQNTVRTEVHVHTPRFHEERDIC